MSTPIPGPQGDPTALVQALVETGRWLAANGYRFTTVTPATQDRVVSRPSMSRARSVRDVFGWSLPFEPSLLPARIRSTLSGAGLLAAAAGGLLRSEVRYSSLEGWLFAHSAYPTTAREAVFFGPDTCRFAAVILQELERSPLLPGARIVDVGCGAGPGGLVAARHAQAPVETVLADISDRALQFARANAELAGASRVAFVHSDLLQELRGGIDLLVCNPPYLSDANGRTYRDGGGLRGEGISLRFVREGLPRLAPGGRLVLYTGAPIVDGIDPLWTALQPGLSQCGWPRSYREVDPDVFGEELAQPAYADAERIAAVALVVQRPRGV